MAILGSLKQVTNLQIVWPRRESDFIQWLSQEDKISLLADAVGIDFIVDRKKSSADSSNGDIFASETETGRKIVIHAQLNTSTDSHLGRLLNYASGNSADIIIWGVKHAREEHRAAIEWLNSHTEENKWFILCEIKVYRIDNFEPAVVFEVVEKPHSWSTHTNDYLEILDFTQECGGLPYQDPASAATQAQRNELNMLKEKGRDAQKKMVKLCKHFASIFNLSLSNTIKWSNYNGTAINEYFWGQLKRQNNHSPISLSIFAEDNHYRLAIELDVKNACESDYSDYKRYYEHPIYSPLLKFYSRQNLPNGRWEIIDSPIEAILDRLNHSNDKEERVQLSYFIYRTDGENHSEKSGDVFYRQFIEGISLLLPYYDYIFDSNNSNV